jgi:Protein of unknown function (DUF1580)
MSILDETTISLHEAAAQFPGRCPGKKLNFSTVWRWVLKGVTANGQVVKLQAVRLGSRWITSKEAIRRFSEALTPTNTNTQVEKSGRTPSRRARDNSAAKKQLEEIG